MFFKTLAVVWGTEWTPRRSPMARRLLFCRRKASGCGVHVLCSAQLAMNSEFRMRTGNRNSQFSTLASMYCNNTNSSHFLIIRIYFHCQLYFHFQFSHFLPFLQGYPEWSGFTLKSLDASLISHFAAVAYGQPRKQLRPIGKVVPVFTVSVARVSAARCSYGAVSR